MSEDPSYGNFAQFGESQETQAIPPISSFAKRNTRLSTSPGAEECSQPGGFYRELTLEGVDPSVPVSGQSTTAPETMQPQSSQPHQQQQQQQHHQQPQQHPEAEQQYAKAMAAAVAAAYQAHAQEMNNMAATSMVSGSGTGPVITSVTSGQVHPSTSGAVSADVVSPPPLLPMQMQAANSTLLGQALQAANDMGGLPALQLAVQHHQQLQQQQQLLQAVQAAHVQNAGQKMMSPTPTSDQTLNNQGTSPSNENEPRDEKTALVNLMPAASLASPVTIQRTDPTNMPTLAPSSQLQTSMSNQLTTSTVNSMPAHVYSMSGATASAPSTNLPAGMINNMSTQVSNLPMGIPSHFMQLNNPQVSMPVPSMLVQAPGPTGQEMISPEQQIMAQGIPNSITNNNDIDMLSNMPTQCPRTPTVKRRNNKKPVPNEDKDDKYYERRSRNNMAAKRSRDSRKRREDQVSMRANFLEKENAILRAQLATLREEANSLRQLLSQQRPIIPPQVPVQAMHKNMSQ